MPPPPPLPPTPPSPAAQQEKNTDERVAGILSQVIGQLRVREILRCNIILCKSQTVNKAHGGQSEQEGHSKVRRGGEKKILPRRERERGGGK